jgi:hypothetical protein
MLPFTGLKDPAGVAVDTAGTVYVTYGGNKRVLKLAGSSTPTELPFTGLVPYAVAVDGAGTLYVTDTSNMRVLKLVAGSSTPTQVPFHTPFGVAVDSAGTLYVTDTSNNQVLKLVAGSSTPTQLPFTGLGPVGVAVDSTGNLYIAEMGDNRVLNEEGLLHRDIKPSNILLDKNDFAYLIDFGIVRTLGETRMTQTGSAIGTFQYVAPERLGTGAEDARADIYSLACVLYECLTGHPPFPGDTMGPLVNAHLNTPPPRPSINQPLERHANDKDRQYDRHLRLHRT